ncbi:MAG: redox-sensing transcriptional repressor Rex [Lentisphaerae bacterium]|jgi:redox-sensing transcriptional repressor|nr:redox-sensing transcriptional repressor Rex [Lentisphaerota bacterium]MBT4817652.1 redox-sensing transcriptional repressor Rex [Lentisphaerota bacterium]MBT5612249.1 redox-sensing transcriptional repressor Rex [Lentisphaerota bacterium]MBT7060773.1 redox-sensing transcriptional repressor Rex [Lentisphaerota bacterium]MBT7845228.1 redox-sensing transcriptional repressor Rex [Lentisphaerota bacterium]
MAEISDKTIARLSLYRRLLSDLLEDGQTQVRSHELATLANGSPAQVRRDLAEAVGCQGRPRQGYDVAGLFESIGAVLDGPSGENVALVGVGNLGRAVLAYLAGRRPGVNLKAAFDSDPAKVGQSWMGCPCHPDAAIPRVIREQSIRVAILAIPAASAQAVAEQLMDAGVTGLMNFAPVRLRARPGVFVENIDIAISLEKTAYFARQAAES